MKIVFVFDGLTTGGITKVGADYANLLIGAGNSVSVINLDPHKKDMVYVFDKSCTQYDFKLKRELVFQRFEPLTTKGAGGAFLYGAIAVIFSFFGLFSKVKSRNKFKSLKETDLLIAFSGHYNDLSFVANGYVKTKAKAAWLHGAEFEYKIVSSGYFDLYKKIKNLVALSNYADATCKKFNDENEINKQVIYNPITIKERVINAEKVAELKKEYGEFCLMVGRLEKDKDQTTVIKAIKYIKDKYNKETTILFVGDGEKKNQLITEAIQLGVEKNVVFCGQRDDVENYYSASRVFVHSSPMEGLPTVLLEAMAYKVPIASTDSIPGVREILGNNECGLIAPIYDYKALGENIYLLLTDEKMRQKLVDKGISRLDDFEPQRILNRVTGYFEEILKETN